MITPGQVVVDLSVTLAEDLPCYWEGHQPFKPTKGNWFGEHPYATRWITIDEHTGTHFDAPLHFIPGELAAEQVALDRLMGAAAVIDAAPGLETRAGSSPLVEPEVITAWEARHGRLHAGEIVLLRTGWDRRYRPGAQGDGYLRDVLAGRAPGWPAPAESAVELLLERGIRCVGIDAPSIGPAHDPVPVHVRGLREGMVFVECLAALDRLPPRGAWFCFLPVKLAGGTGAPGRAVALLSGDLVQ